MIVSTVKLKYGVHAGQAVEGMLLANAYFEQTVRRAFIVVTISKFVIVIECLRPWCFAGAL